MGLKWEGERRDPCKSFYVLPVNAAAAEVFTALSTNWRVMAFQKGVRITGIEYAAIPAVLDMLGVKHYRRRDIFDRLRVIELSALEALNSER